MSAIENIVYPYYKMLIRWNNIVYFLWMKCWYSINEPTYIFFYKGLYDFLIHFKEIFDAKDTLDISLCNQRSLFFI